MIILLNVYVFYLELTASNPDMVIARYALISSQVNFDNLRTLIPFISSQFLHGGFLHIISNMLFLWVFGRNVEARWRIFFPVLYLGSGAVGGLVQHLIDPFSNIPMLGASGAVAGVLGSYFTFFPRHKIKTLIFVFFFVTIVEIPAAVLLFYWFMIQVLALSIFPVGQGGIAYAAHVGGFATGLVISQLFFRIGSTK
ncbi:MAG: rhomboid family intramembrane serine protease [Candidatus Daviesbacteria bacterium]|nr:MAG: rhomboid family intramembrane serine protease [Candidatus Daviesbacteria bacterium]